jgi:anti-sigma regulatory factor (Ser/Thr protein kinase)
MSGQVPRLAELAPASEWTGTYTLPRSPHSSALARVLLRQALADCPPETVQAAELLVSELVTNALRHAETAPTLHIQPLQSGFRIVIEDDSPDPVDLKPAAPEADSGYGLSVVDALASSWGWQPTATGKRVWFELGEELAGPKP